MEESAELEIWAQNPPRTSELDVVVDFLLIIIYY